MDTAVIEEARAKRFRYLQYHKCLGGLGVVRPYSSVSIGRNENGGNGLNSDHSDHCFNMCHVRDNETLSLQEKYWFRRLSLINSLYKKCLLRLEPRPGKQKAEERDRIIASVDGWQEYRYHCSPLLYQLYYRMSSSFSGHETTDRVGCHSGKNRSISSQTC